MTVEPVRDVVWNDDFLGRPCPGALPRFPLTRVTGRAALVLALVILGTQLYAGTVGVAQVPVIVGVALAALLIMGPPLALVLVPGIALLMQIDGRLDFGFSVMLGMVTAAVMGFFALLLRDMVNFSTELERPRDLVWLLLGGAVAAMAQGILGASLFGLARVADWPDVAANALMWAVTEAHLMMICTPLILRLYTVGPTRDAWRAQFAAVPGGAGEAVLLLSAVIVFLMVDPLRFGLPADLTLPLILGLLAWAAFRFHLDGTLTVLSLALIAEAIVGPQAWTGRFPNHLFEIAASGTFLIAAAMLGHLYRRVTAGEVVADRLTHFAKVTSEWFWETDADMRFTRVSRDLADQDARGLPLLGRRREDIATTLEPRDMARYRAAIEAREPIRGFTFVGKNHPFGTDMCFRIDAFPVFGAGGQFVGYRGVSLDITSEVRSRQRADFEYERFLAAVEGLEDAFALFDDTHRLILGNTRFRQIMSELGEAAEAGLPLDAVLRAMNSLGRVADALGEESGWVDAQLDVAEEPSSFEVSLGARWYSVQLTAIVDGGMVLRAVDITETRARVEQLRQSHRMEAIGHMTGGVAHDFNNLLSIISMNLEMVEEDLPEAVDDEAPMLRRAVQRALEASGRGADLTRRLLAFARRQVLQPRDVDPNDLILRMTDLIGRTLGASIDFETDLTLDIGAIRVDRAQLENVLLNLCINARDAMPDGGRLIVETAPLERDVQAAIRELSAGPTIRITVRDSGSGMAPETARRALEPFFTTKEPGRGTGLGLSMAYGFVKQSGGHLVIDSQLDVGTSIHIYLPRHAAPQPVAADPPPDTPAVVEDDVTILVVEDEAEVRHLAERALKDLGYTVLSASNGAEALSLLEEEGGAVDLLFTDIVLPQGINGIEIARRARLRLPHLPVLFTSGYPGTPSPDPLPGPMLSKPYRKQSLAAQIAEILATGRQEG